MNTLCTTLFSLYIRQVFYTFNNASSVICSTLYPLILIFAYTSSGPLSFAATYIYSLHPSSLPFRILLYLFHTVGIYMFRPHLFLVLSYCAIFLSTSDILGMI